MTKIAAANAIIVPFVWTNEEYYAYGDHTRSEWQEFIPYFCRQQEDSTCADHYTPRLFALEYATIVHLGLWGTSFLFNILGMTHGFKIIFAPLAALWIEHVISNFHLLATLYVSYLFFDADFGWAMTSLYFFQGIIMWILERNQGMPAIKHLRPNYPYLDGTLKPSILYLFGINKHTESYPFMDAEWPEDTGEEI